MHIHILGICGTFMGGIALLARALGHRVTGSDAHVYPPMSVQLSEQGIELMEGYDPGVLEPPPDMVVIGNALSRGNPLVEQVLDQGLPYTSGPQWLAEHVLLGRWVLAVAGTHGKTTTSGMLAWILQHAGLEPGFLIGGVPQNFGVSARLGSDPFLVVEADEYDTAFFDKRSKFVHYRPRTLVLNNLEYDHADIFPDLEAIQRQFHHLVRIVPSSGLIIRPADDTPLDEVIGMGCWTPQETFGDQGAHWSARLGQADGSVFDVRESDRQVGTVNWGLLGIHNVNNALAAIAAARHAGVDGATACDALAQYRNVKRRLEHRATIDGITVYDDFAHHPTAIRHTLDGLRRKVGEQRIIAILEPRSNTMRMGVHKHSLGESLKSADMAILFQPPQLGWSLTESLSAMGERALVCPTLEDIVAYVEVNTRPGDNILIMSNGAFGDIHRKLMDMLERRHA